MAKGLYREMQHTTDEPLNINHLTKHLKTRLNWKDSEIKSLRSKMSITSGTVDFERIVEFLSKHKTVAMKLQKHFLNNPAPFGLPAAPSMSDLHGLPVSYSSYHLQRQQELRPRMGLPTVPQMMVSPSSQMYHVYDQLGSVAVGGSTHAGGGGTVYQNPLYHGSLAFANPSPRARGQLTAGTIGISVLFILCNCLYTVWKGGNR